MGLLGQRGQLVDNMGMDSLSFLDPDPQRRLAMARALLAKPKTGDAAWPALAAAALFAISALGLAFASITAQPAEFTPVPVVERAVDP